MDARLLRTFSLSAGLRVLRLGIGLLLASQLGRHLGTEGFGALSVSMATVAVLLCVGELGFARVTVRRLMTSGEPDGEVLGVSVGARLVVSATLFGLLCAGLWWAQPETWLLLLIYGAQLLTNPATELICWMEARQLMGRVAVTQFVGFAASAVCIAAGIWLEAPVWYFAVTYAVEGWTFLALSGWLFWRAGGRVRLNTFRVKEAIRAVCESWPELASQLALLLLFRLDAIMVGVLRGAGEAGIYSACVRLSELVYFVPTILASLYLPRMIELKQSQAGEYRRRMTDYFSLSLLVAGVCAGCLALGAPLLGWVFGEEFAQGTPILVVHAWSFIPYAVGIARTQYLTVENRLWVNVPSVVGALLVNAALNWWWIPVHGGLGAAWATLTAYTLAWVLSSFVMPGVARDVGELLSRATLQLPRFAVATVRRVCAGRWVRVTG